MKRELKIRILDLPGLRQRFDDLGAEFLESKAVTDIYFRAGEGEVKKINIVNGQAQWMELHAEQGGFVIDHMEAIENLDAFLSSLPYEEERRLIKEQSFWKLHGEDLNLNEIVDVGDFLVLESENPDPAFFSAVLGIEDPEFITVAFSKL